MNDNWKFLDAMNRSHRWHDGTSIPADRRCSACGDTLDSMVRYCPGAYPKVLKDNQ